MWQRNKVLAGRSPANLATLGDSYERKPVGFLSSQRFALLLTFPLLGLIE